MTFRVSGEKSCGCSPTSTSERRAASRRLQSWSRHSWIHTGRHPAAPSSSTTVAATTPTRPRIPMPPRCHSSRPAVAGGRSAGPEATGQSRWMKTVRRPGLDAGLGAPAPTAPSFTRTVQESSRPSSARDLSRLGLGLGRARAVDLVDVGDPGGPGDPRRAPLASALGVVGLVEAELFAGAPASPGTPRHPSRAARGTPLQVAALAGRACAPSKSPRAPSVRHRRACDDRATGFDHVAEASRAQPGATHDPDLRGGRFRAECHGGGNGRAGGEDPDPEPGREAATSPRRATPAPGRRGPGR